jgi:hypothetical protein
VKLRTLDVTPGQRLDDAVAWATCRPGYESLGVLFRAVAEQRIGLTLIFDHRAAWTPRSIASKIPRVVLISDDREQSRGPEEWRCAISAITWARTAVVHGAGAEIEHYSTAVLSAEITGRCLFVETTSVHAPAWAAAIEPRGVPFLVIVPGDGGVHPVVEAAVTP